MVHYDSLIRALEELDARCVERRAICCWILSCATLDGVPQRATGPSLKD